MIVWPKAEAANEAVFEVFVQVINVCEMIGWWWLGGKGLIDAGEELEAFWQKVEDVRIGLMVRNEAVDEFGKMVGCVDGF